MPPALSEPPASAFRRARPLLGTFVEMALWGGDETLKQTASDQAFDAIALVESTMSRFIPDSDIGRLNRGQSPDLHPWTVQILNFCDRMEQSSGGRFTPRAVGHLDLGGVAKGFAVDRAIDTLKAHGIEAGMVNAGGDLAVFGPTAQTIHSRDPRQPARLLPPIAIKNAALASSAPAFDPVTGALAAASAILDPRTGLPATGALGASVRAPDAMTADALTKIVMIMGGQAWPLLSQWRAEAWMIQADGTETHTAGWT
jgi:thiamine biosynthesis lipoprotein